MKRQPGLFSRRSQVRPEIRDVQNKILNRILIFCLLPGILAIIPGAIKAYAQGHWLYAVLYFCSYLAFLFSFFSARRATYRVRAFSLVFGLFLLTISVLWKLGLSGVGLELLIICCFTSAILFSVRTGFTLAIISFAGVSLLAFGMVGGFIAVDTNQLLTSLSGLSWAAGAVAFFLGTILIIMSPQMLYLRLEESLKLAEAQAETLHTRNKQLQEEIKKREQAEMEQGKLRHLLQDIIDSMPSVLFAVDLNMCVTLWNLRIADFMEIPAEEALGKPFMDFFPKLETQIQLLKEAIESRKSQTIERLPIQHENRTIYIDCIVYPISGNGQTGAVIRIDSATQRVLMEETMIQSEKMISVGGLAAGMAHEINNPLGGILQGIQNIERRLSPDMNGNQKSAKSLDLNLDRLQDYLTERKIYEFIQGIRDAGMRASRIISNMLIFSRKSESQAAQIDIHNLLDNTIELARSDYDLKKNFDFKHIDLIREYDPELQTLWCTETELEQVILNLLRNAAQALEEKEGNDKPHITIRTKKDDKTVVIEVEDNGPGMNEETRKRIFEPFFTTKPIGEGTGLGLSVSYMIITNNHKGSMNVQTEPGQGTLFTIRVPLTRLPYEENGNDR